MASTTTAGGRITLPCVRKTGCGTLLSREGVSPLVKSVALTHGFWHLGQFAHDYRATFGEMPSETLARARG